MAKKKQSSDVKIGYVSGGIHGSIISGKDIRDVIITIEGREIKADTEPNINDLLQLLTAIKRDLSEMESKSHILNEISVAAPFIIQGAERSIKETTENVTSDLDSQEAESIQNRLSDVIKILTVVLDGARTLANKTYEVGQSVAPIIEKLEPLIMKIGIVAMWIDKLWSAK